MTLGRAVRFRMRAHFSYLIPSRIPITNIARRLYRAISLVTQSLGFRMCTCQNIMKVLDTALNKLD